MITILFADTEKLWQNNDPEAALKSLPRQIAGRIKAYRLPQDQLLRLTGKLLLEKIFSGAGITGALSKINYDAYNRPCIAGSAVDFNISHSGSIAVCAVADSGKTGIDIELVRPIEWEMYQDFFEEKEWHEIVAAPDPLIAFYRSWTRREACLKASGTGLAGGSASVSLHAWETQELFIAEGYAASLAASAGVHSYIIKELAQL